MNRFNLNEAFFEELQSTNRALVHGYVAKKRERDISITSPLSSQNISKFVKHSSQFDERQLHLTVDCSSICSNPAAIKSSTQLTSTISSSGSSSDSVQVVSPTCTITTHVSTVRTVITTVTQDAADNQLVSPIRSPHQQQQQQQPRHQRQRSHLACENTTITCGQKVARASHLEKLDESPVTSSLSSSRSSFLISSSNQTIDLTSITSSYDKSIPCAQMCRQSGRPVTYAQSPSTIFSFLTNDDDDNSVIALWDILSDYRCFLSFLFQNGCTMQERIKYFNFSSCVCSCVF